MVETAHPYRVVIGQAHRTCSIRIAYEDGEVLIRTGEMSPLLGPFTALPEDTSSVPSTHVRWLTTICNSSTRVPNTLSSGFHMYQHPHAHTPHKQFKIVKIILKCLYLSIASLFHEILLWFCYVYLTGFTRVVIMLLYLYKLEHFRKLGKYSCHPSFRSCRHKWMLFYNVINIQHSCGPFSSMESFAQALLKVARPTLSGEWASCPCPASTYRWKQKSQAMSLLTVGMRMGLACIFLPRITNEVSFGGKGLDVCSIFPLLDHTNFKLKLLNTNLQIVYADPHAETPNKTKLKVLIRVHFFFPISTLYHASKVLLKAFPTWHIFYIYRVIQTMVTYSTQILFGSAKGKRNQKVISFHQ